MKVLIIHHIEPMWEISFRYDEYRYIKEVLDYVHYSDFDCVIMTTLEGDWYPELYAICDVHHEWTYNWEDPEDNADEYVRSGIDPEDIIRALGHEYTYLYPWIKALKYDDVTLIGGGVSACLLDLENALDHLDINNTQYRNLTF